MTPMQQDFPAICDWVRHQCVSTEALRAELALAMDWLDGIREIPGHEADEAHAPCEWCGRAIHSPLGSRLWFAVKGIERGYDPKVCDASDDGKHTPTPNSR